MQRIAARQARAELSVAAKWAPRCPFCFSRPAVRALLSSGRPLPFLSASFPRVWLLLRVQIVFMVAVLQIRRLFFALQFLVLRIHVALRFLVTLRGAGHMFGMGSLLQAVLQECRALGRIGNLVGLG